MGKKSRVEIADVFDAICGRKDTEVFLGTGPFVNHRRDGIVQWPEELLLDKEDDAGIFFGGLNQFEEESFIGMPQGYDGNVMVVGGNGSGKSSGIAMTTFETWREAIIATDIKGELSRHYAALYRCGLVKRPYIVFDPTDINGPGYDPFGWLEQDEPDNLVQNMREIASTIVPLLPEAKEPFWPLSERDLFAAFLVYYFKLGLSFSESVCMIVGSRLSDLCETLIKSDDYHVKTLLGDPTNLKDTVRANLDRGLRNELMVFGTDRYISHMFRGRREGARCFTWDDLKEYNIFLRIPADKVEAWGSAITLMCTQLIRHLERRPDQYSTDRQNLQTLILLDEFARFGKLEMITAAMATLRSKNVNFCVMIQSIAQLDKIYGEYDRRIIFDNCQYQVILRANDPETQDFLSKLIGTSERFHASISKQADKAGKLVGYTQQVTTTRDYTVHPHELARLREVLLLTPEGLFSVKKFQPNRDKRPVNSVLPAWSITGRGVLQIQHGSLMKLPKYNQEVEIMPVDKRAKKAKEKSEQAEKQRRVKARQQQGDQKKMDQRRNYILGELVIKYFPEVCEIVPGSNASENEIRFKEVEAVLKVLSSDSALVQKLKDLAAETVWQEASQEAETGSDGPDV